MRLELYAASPGLFVIKSGGASFGLWLRVGLDRRSAATRAGAPLRSGEEPPGLSVPFDTLPVDFPRLLGWMVERAIPLLGPRAQTLLLVVEWSREILVRTQVGEQMEVNPGARGGLAICQLRELNRPTYALRGDSWLEVRQVPLEALKAGEAEDPARWIPAALVADGPREGAAASVMALPPAPGLASEGVALPLEGNLDRELLYWRPLPWSSLYRRTLSTPLLISLSARTTLTAAGLAAIALMLGAAFSVRLRQARPTPALSEPALLATLPVGLCTPDSAPFRAELRCQVHQIARKGELKPDCSGGDPNLDLQPDMCGLLDRVADGALVSPLAAADGPLRDAGELALSQACFKMLGSPPSYALDSSGQGLRWGDPDRLLRGTNALSDLVELTRRIESACTDSTTRLRTALQGAVLATHVGARSPAESVSLRDEAVEAARAELPPDLRACLEQGSQAPQVPTRYDAICAPSEAARSRAFAMLSGRDLDDEPLANRYLNARYGALDSAAPKDDLWACQLALSGAKPPGTPDAAPGAWSVPVPIPRTYGDGRGAQSELVLDAALQGLSGGQELGVCWETVAGLLPSFPLVHPLLGALDPKGWPVEPQQLCGQVCRVAFGPDRADVERLTPEADLSACLRLDDPGESAPSFPPLALPWNGQTGAVPPASSPGRWMRPSAAQICGFHVLAQGGLDLGRKDWLPAGLTGPGWAGEYAVDEVAGVPAGVAGSPDGEAATAARQFQGTSADPRAGELECGAVALQCFSGLAFQVAGAGSRTRWPERWSAEVLRLSRQDPAIIAEEAPWCGLVHAYLAPRAVTEELDATCRMGVEAARAGIADALTLARERP